MNPRHVAAGLLALTLAAGCGGSAKESLSTDVGAQLRAAASKTATSGSSKLQLTSTTLVGGQQVTFDGTGAFDYASKVGSIVLHIAGLGAGSGGVTLAERITGGNLYLQLPNAPGTFYKLALSDLVGTSLADGSDPSSSFSALSGVSGPITKVGTETVRGTATTHYRGSIDVQKALAKASPIAAAAIRKNLVGHGVTTLPFDAYLDGQGRLRKYVQHVAVTAQGQKVDSTTTVELYDFGTKVSVTAPPAAQVKDGSAILAAIKAQAGK